MQSVPRYTCRKTVLTTGYNYFLINNIKNNSYFIFQCTRLFVQWGRAMTVSSSTVWTMYRWFTGEFSRFPAGDVWFNSSFLWASPGKGREATTLASSMSSHNCPEIREMLPAPGRTAFWALPERKSQTPRLPGEREGPPRQTPRTLNPHGSWRYIRAFVYFSLVIRLYHRTCRFCSRIEVVLPCREVPGLCSNAAPGCFGWFGGKLSSLHHLFQIGGPLVANCGWKIRPLGKKLGFDRPPQLTVRSALGPQSWANNFVMRGGHGRGMMRVFLH